MAPAVGFEPTTKRLTAARSTTELRRSEGPPRAVAGRTESGSSRRRAAAEDSTRLGHTRRMQDDATGRPDAVARGPLITVEALAARLDDPHVRVVDVRWVLGQPGAGRRAYEGGHIPGAIFLDLDGELALAPAPGRPGRHPLPSPAAFAATLAGRRDRLGRPRGRLRRRRGLGRGPAVVDARRPRASRRRGGPRRRDPGVGRGRSSRCRPAVPARPPVPASLELADHWSKVIDRDEPPRPSRRGGPARCPRGARATAVRSSRSIRTRVTSRPPSTPRPTAAWSSRTAGSSQPEALRARFERLRATAIAAGAASPDGPMVTSCGSGVSAAHVSLAMRVAGLPDPILYVGSYSDWSRGRGARLHRPRARHPRRGPPTGRLGQAEARRPAG